MRSCSEEAWAECGSGIEDRGRESIFSPRCRMVRNGLEKTEMCVTRLAGESEIK